MTPSWYDLLGVAPDASADEIRAAWKAGIADLEPTDRRFRVLNQAAEVLLDPPLRAEYDATLDLPAVVDEPPPVAEERVAAAETIAPEMGGELVTEPAGRGISGLVLAVLAALTAVLVGLATWLATQPSDDAVADATSEAQAAAEDAVVTILAYDYRSMDEDQTAAGALMTDDYRAEYDNLFAVLEENAAATKTVVTVDDPLASGIARADVDRVEVLVFVNRPTQNAEEQRVFHDQVRLTMERVGDDWLVDNMETTPTGA